MGMTLDTEESRIYWITRSAMGSTLQTLQYSKRAEKSTIIIANYEDTLITGPIRYFNDKLLWIQVRDFSGQSCMQFIVTFMYILPEFIRGSNNRYLWTREVILKTLNRFKHNKRLCQGSRGLEMARWCSKVKNPSEPRTSDGRECCGQRDMEQFQYSLGSCTKHEL